MRPILTILTVASMIGVVGAANPAAAQSENEDPLGLALYAEIERQYSLGNDLIGVFVCEGTPHKAPFYAHRLERSTGPWFEHHSRGRYNPVYQAQGEILPADWFLCTGGTNTAEEDELSARYPELTNAMIIGPNLRAAAQNMFLCSDGPAGSGSPVYACPTLAEEPLKHRWMTQGSYAFAEAGTIDYDWFFNYSNFIHEVGHTLYWPHTSTDKLLSPYDTFGDVMSGGGRSSRPGEPPPRVAPAAGTNVFNLYRAGWIDPGEVEIVSGPQTTIELHPNHAASGLTRMAVIPSGDEFYVLGAKPGGPHDVILDKWEGVEIFRVYADPIRNYPGNQRAVPLYAIPTRDIPQGETFTDYELLDRRLPHVIAEGGSAYVAGHTVQVLARTGDSFSVKVTKGTDFVDTSGSVFEANIDWLAGAEITQGCNPPHNTEFCPDQAVTRAQMASFLTRGLSLAPADPGRFQDVRGANPHQADIASLAGAGITRGCNPPANDRFCPNQAVTRAQMASFLTRALHLAAGDVGGFRDVASSNPHRVDIASLAGAGITRGCNPPANTRYCPDDSVTRGQMAAFLFRALGN